ncbi:MAG: sulfite exporter TauE/SafE family protein [Bacteroidota bacterium]|nr:sulfite exporter TauE/SafE family protein [Bacteroidota bacterium]
MLQIFLSAFTLGILGSFHCVGMCGPIAMALPLKEQSDWGKFSGALIYNLGRITTYSVFGLVFGLIGRSFGFFGYQQGVSIILGVLILISIFLPSKITTRYGQNILTNFFTKIRSSIGTLFSKRNRTSLYTIGLLNGLLPCGLVYMAAALAIATGAVVRGIVFMMAFGLGTLPLMWGMAFFGSFIKMSLRQKIRKAYPYFMTAIALLLILRGLGLGIPFVSPRIAMGQHMAPISCGK